MTRFLGVSVFSRFSRVRRIAGLVAWCGIFLFTHGILQAQPPAPWGLCPAVGADTSCAILIVVNADRSVSVYTDPSVGPYDGYDDTLIGVQNNSSSPVAALSINSSKPSFAFSGDGICDTVLVPAPHPAGCPFGPTGYEGPGVSYTVPGGLSQSACGFGYNGPWVCANDLGASSGVVNFSPAIAPGGHAYFGLQEPLTAEDIQPSLPGSPSNPGENVRFVTTTDKLPSTCPGTPATVSNFAPGSKAVYLYFVVDNVAQNDSLTDIWVSPQGSQYVSNSWGPASGTVCFSDRMDIAGSPPSGMPGTWTVQIYVNQKLLTTAQFTIGSASLPRVGVLAHVAAGGGWLTSISLVNTSSSPVTANVVFHTNDGSVLNLPVAGNGASKSAAAVISSNALLVIDTVDQSSNTLQTGWAEVLASGALDGFAILRYAGSDGTASEGTIPLQTQFPSKLILPFDNTSGFSTGLAIANLAANGARVLATIWDRSGSQIGSESINLVADGHGGYMLPDLFTETTGQGGTIEFQNPDGGGLAAIGLRFSPQGTFTSVPTILLR